MVLSLSCLLYASVALLMGTGVVSAQGDEPGRVLLGPSVFIGAAVDDAQVPVFGTTVNCGEFSSGTAFTPMLGGSFLLPQLFSDRFGLQASALLGYSSGRLTTEPLEPVRILDDETASLVELEEEYRIGSDIVSFSIDILPRYSLGDRVALALGPSFGYRISSAFSQTDHVFGPGDYRFEDGQSERALVGGPRLEGNGFTAGGVLQATWELPLGERSILMPGAQIRADLLSPVHDYSWRRLSVGASLSLLFDLDPSSDTPVEPIPDPPEPRIPRLAASIAIFGVDENDNPLPAARISVFETFYRQHAPLLPYLFFSHASSILPERYSRPVKIDSFSLDGLAGSSVLDIQHDILNVIGLRMREHDNAVVTLNGSISRDEPSDLALLRAETARNYLKRIWGIDPSRLVVDDNPGSAQRSNESTEDGRADNRRVEIGTNNPAVMAPVVTVEVVRDFDPPMIKMDPDITAEAGIKRWEIVVSQQGAEVARYTSDDRMNEQEVTWQIVRERIDSALAPLVATLTVEDSTGAVVTARTEAPLVMVKRPKVVDRRIERDGDHERIAYQLVGFDFGSWQLEERQRSALRDVAGSVNPGARVTIVGYTDRIGKEKPNSQLAAGRAESVAAALRHILDELKVPDVTVRTVGAGVETERFTNDLPEGRFLSRGVAIVVEQMVAPSGTDGP